MLGLSALLVVGLTGCDREPEAQPLPRASGALPSAPQSGKPTLPTELHPKPKSSAPEAPAAAVPPPPHPGPWFVVTSSSTGLYEKPSFDKEGKFGYARNGERLPVSGPSKPNESCSGGWYAPVGGGFASAPDVRQASGNWYRKLARINNSLAPRAIIQPVSIAA